jgi:hypothetical protein
MALVSTVLKMSSLKNNNYHHLDPISYDSHLSDRKYENPIETNEFVAFHREKCLSFDRK